MDPKYDICFAGEILQGQDSSAVKLNIAKLFKADEATLNKLFSGKTQLLKRGCDRETALKYKKAIEQAGGKPLIRAHSDIEKPAPAIPDKPPAAKMTAAERIALLAGAPDVASSGNGTRSSTEPPGGPGARAEVDDAFDLAPPGADVLRPEERTDATPAEVDTSTMSLMEVGTDLSDATAAPGVAPDISHLSMGEVGDDIPTLPASQQTVSPDISGISLSPEDSDFSDCAPTPAQEPDLDLSTLDLAPSGADLLEDSYRKEDDATAPVTDHLQLKD
ncbi:MAG: hypothetical protein V7709_01245 [Halioglobus sp.]